MTPRTLISLKYPCDQILTLSKQSTMSKTIVNLASPAKTETADRNRKSEPVDTTLLLGAIVLIGMKYEL